jgi:EEF1A N-terminal glycine/lysine methyltransferase
MAIRTKDFEDESGSFSNLFHHENDSEEENEDAHFEQVGGHKYELHCAPNDGTSPGSLFAFNVWSGSVQLAEYLHKNPSLVENKYIVELGAAAALPSLVALTNKASKVLITDYPNEMILDAIRLNVEVNKSILGTAAATVSSAGKRWFVQGHLWGSEVEAHHQQHYDVAIVAECLWNHKLHDGLLDSIDAFLKPGGIVLLSYAHHVKGLEAADDAFFTTAFQSKHLTSELLETKEMRYMWDANKTVTQYLYVLKKPPLMSSISSLSSSVQNDHVEANDSLSNKSLFQKLQGLSVTEEEVVSASTTTSSTQQRDDDDDGDSSSTLQQGQPNDSESLAIYMRKQAEEIAKEEEMANKELLQLPKDENGYVLPISLPGPRAPKHEDHPAYGMRIWPPRRPVASSSNNSGSSLPSWVNGEEDMNPFPDWTSKE